METIVFVHGLGSSSRAWRPQVTALEPDFDVKAIDLPGHGEHRDEFTLDGAVNTLCDAIGSGAHVVAISGGATIAMLTAIAAGQHVKSLVLSAPVAHTPPTFALQRAVTALLPLSALSAMVAPMYSGGNDEYRAIAVEDLRRCGKANLRRAFAKLAHTDLRDQLGQIKVPTLVMCGSADRANIAPATLVAETIPEAVLRTIDGAGHIWNLQQPELFTSLVAGFVSDHGD